MKRKAAIWQGVAGCIGVLAVCVACAAGPRTVQTVREAGIPSLEAALPALPKDLPSGGGRIGEAVTAITLVGADCYDRSRDDTKLTADHKLQFIHWLKECRWALYRFEGVGENATPKLLTVTWEGDADDRGWIAVPDYTAGSWRFIELPPPAGISTFELPEGALVSASGNLYIGVIVPAQTMPTIASLRVDVDVKLPPVQRVAATWRSLADSIRVSWDLPEETYHDDPEFAYDKLVVERSIQSNGPWTTVGELSPGTSGFLDTGGSEQLLAQLDYYYRVRCGLGSSIGMASETAVGSTGIPAVPKILAAPDDGQGMTTVTLDASYSTTINSSNPLLFEWDVNNDGAFDFLGAEVTTDLDLSSDRLVTVRVTDEYGLSTLGSKILKNMTYGRLWVHDDPNQDDPDLQVQFVGGSGPKYTWNIRLGYVIELGQSPFTVEVDTNYDSVFGPAIIPCGVKATLGHKTDTIGVYSQPGEYYFALRCTDTAVPPPPGIGVDTLIWPKKVKLEVPPQP